MNVNIDILSESVHHTESKNMHVCTCIRSMCSVQKEASELCVTATAAAGAAADGVGEWTKSAHQTTANFLSSVHSLTHPSLFSFSLTSQFEQLWKYIQSFCKRYLLGDGESNDGVPLQDLPRDHGGVDLNLSDGHIERSWQQGVWHACTFNMATWNKLEETGHEYSVVTPCNTYNRCYNADLNTHIYAPPSLSHSSLAPASLNSPLLHLQINLAAFINTRSN